MPHPNRDDPFQRIGALSERCDTQGSPIIRIDTKKKEWAGAFKNPGAKWDREPVCVNDHDFRSDADDIAVPYGVYDVQANLGTVFVSTSHDTPGSLSTVSKHGGAPRGVSAMSMTDT